MRTTTTVALLAAAVGVPYTATETELGQSATELGKSAVGMVQSQAQSVTALLISSGSEANSHREVEKILVNGIERYRYPEVPQVIARHMGGPQPNPATDPRAWANPQGAGAVASGTYSAPGSPAGGPHSSGAAPGATGAPPPNSGAPAVIPSSMTTPVSTVASRQLKGGAAMVSSIADGPIHDLRDVLRFDITADWVTARFTRVSTVLADTHLEGLRVPLVTGIGTADLAGTITYYFDYSGKLQRVMLHAITGDVSRVVETMTQHYGLATEPSLDAGVFTKRWNALPVHFLRVSRAPIVYRDALHHKFTVFIELNQPDLRFGISEEASQIITSDRNTGRW